MAVFADTNVFIHFLLDYDPERGTRCRDLLRAAEEGRERLETSHLVIAELVWFLSRPPLRLSPAEVRDRIVPLIGLRGLRIPDKTLLIDAMDTFASTGVGFVDAFNAAFMRRRGLDRILTYDRDFDRIPDITRTEP